MASEFFKFVDDHAESFINRLGEAVAIPSVSEGESHRPDVVRMGKWLHEKLTSKDIGVDAQLVELPDNLPPLVIGRVGNNPKLKTVLVYGHYDVQPADAKGWAEENPDAPDPFVLTRLPKDKPTKLYGRGSTDDKGPVTGWLNVFQAHKGRDLPVNVRFLFEGMEEQASPGLEQWIGEEVKKSDGLFAGVSCVCITDNYWLTTRRPTLTYGLRGIAAFSMEVTGAKSDLHSGIYGRMVHEPMTDLVKLLGKLVGTNGVITIPGIEEMVPPPTEQEKQEYRDIDYTVDDLVKDTGNHVELSEAPDELLMGRMRYPSLSIHGIDGGREGTIIPRQVTARFSIRLVEPQTPEKVEALVQDYLYDEFDKLGSRNIFKVNYELGALPWVGDKNDWNFNAANAATEAVYGSALVPNRVREGGTLPLALVFAQQVNKSVLLLPMGKSDDGAHSLSEKIDISNYINGTKLFGAYLYEIAKVKENGVVGNGCEV